MATVTIAPDTDPGVGPRATGWLHDVLALTRRNLLHVRREPLQLSDATVQPVLFTLLFTTIFGGSMIIPGGGDYKAFAIGGLVAMNLSSAVMGTAVGLTTDLSTGVMNRFRTLPMARSAILAGRTLSDILSAALCGTIVVLTGLVIGWRPENGLAGVLAGLAVAVVFSHALTWLVACMGLLVGDPESAQGVGLLILFPLAFISGAVVPIQGLPTWLQPIAEWNPVSAVAGSARQLFGNPDPATLTGAWPTLHPVPVVLGWSALILAVCVPLASLLLRRHTTD